MTAPDAEPEHITHVGRLTVGRTDDGRIRLTGPPGLELVMDPHVAHQLADALHQAANRQLAADLMAEAGGG